MKSKSRKPLVHGKVNQRCGDTIRYQEEFYKITREQSKNGSDRSTQAFADAYFFGAVDHGKNGKPEPSQAGDYNRQVRENSEDGPKPYVVVISVFGTFSPESIIPEVCGILHQSAGPHHERHQFSPYYGVQ